MIIKEVLTFFYDFSGGLWMFICNGQGGNHGCKLITFWPVFTWAYPTHTPALDAGPCLETFVLQAVLSCFYLERAGTVTFFYLLEFEAVIIISSGSVSHTEWYISMCFHVFVFIFGCIMTNSPHLSSVSLPLVSPFAPSCSSPSPPWQGF